MSIPAGPVRVPAQVLRLARELGAPGEPEPHLTPVWRNGLGGLTFRVTTGKQLATGNGPRVHFLKHGPLDPETSMAQEAKRLAWAAPHTPVPRVVSHGKDTTHEWLITEALDGLSAVDPRWLAAPETAARAVGQGLRALHDALPTENCPFDWSVHARLTNAAQRGIDVPPALRDAPPIDRLVVCHGDACVPNTLLDDAGHPSGHVDLGALGLGDFWADLAVASMSTEWNYGPGYEATLIEAYGVEPDREQLAYYRALWNAT
ncbi:aminoglycoside 3'-phosphotransferase [Galactobacter caseinivorans]|uniref:Aminoglycoside 3'-phosphotransferase n=1 Tax=Galactobacter caseinivorans TaxID=2676123 RepID=A0A496PJQ8_9MICC|nr:aminoglycoside 3'-phosphotransferase [Galactobacter caseinivorans]RKW70733.1 aminoglycoside 3'-phosphotransferase [Galactobacter caseinivorans]